MNYERVFTPLDLELAESLASFLPQRIYDIHAHFYHAAHDPHRKWANLLPGEMRLGQREWREALARNPAFCGKQVSGLFFGAVARGSIMTEMNTFIREEVDALDDPLSQALLVATPDCDQASVQTALREGRYKGIKVYHCYAAREDTMNAEIAEYMPEWMWAAVDEAGGVMMLHLVLPTAVADRRNQRDIRRLCEKYPRVKLILAHAARCFSHRHAVGMAAVSDLPNVYVDTSVVCESRSLLDALRQFGPRRVMYGSDFFVSEMRGRCVTLGSGFHWIYGREVDEAVRGKMTLIGNEALLALREALEEFGATERDVNDLFWNNALRCLDLEESGISSPVAEGH